VPLLSSIAGTDSLVGTPSIGHGPAGSSLEAPMIKGNPTSIIGAKPKNRTRRKRW
jgi:hypothetical protein